MSGLPFLFCALFFLGFLAARRRLVPSEAVPAFNGFLLYFAVPAMLFRFAANTPFQEITNVTYFIAWGVAGTLVVVLVTFLARRWLGMGVRDSAFFGLTAAVAN